MSVVNYHRHNGASCKRGQRVFPTTMDGLCLSKRGKMVPLQVEKNGDLQKRWTDSSPQQAMMAPQNRWMFFPQVMDAL